MTTIVVWEVDELPGRFIDKTILVISDSRASKSGGAGLLTDRCEKIASIDVCFHKRLPGEIQDDELIEETIIVAVAGSTLVAHNAILCAQYALGTLIGLTQPSTKVICEFFAELLTDITKDVGQLQGNSALAEVILVGRESNKPTAFSLKPEFPFSGPPVYVVNQIDEFPYVVGSDKNVFKNEYKKALDDLQHKGATSSAIGQLPFKVFDGLFLTRETAEKTGGEMHIAAVNKEMTRRFMPMRWSDEQGMYEYFVFRKNVFQKTIGDCAIGVEPWQLGS